MYMYFFFYMAVCENGLNGRGPLERKYKHTAHYETDSDQSSLLTVSCL